MSLTKRAAAPVAGKARASDGPPVESLHRPLPAAFPNVDAMPRGSRLFGVRGTFREFFTDTGYHSTRGGYIFHVPTFGVLDAVGPGGIDVNAPEDGVFDRGGGYSRHAEAAFGIRGADVGEGDAAKVREGASQKDRSGEDSLDRRHRVWPAGIRSTFAHVEVAREPQSP
jgi:hypothetical protein